MATSNLRVAGQTSKTPQESGDRVLQGLLERYTTTVDETVKKESLAVSARGYYLFKVTERRCAAAVSFNRVLEESDYSYEDEVVEEVEEPASPPRYGRDVYRKKVLLREKIKQAANDRDGGEHKSTITTKSSLARADKVEDEKHIAERYERGRQLLKGNENQESSTSLNCGTSVRARRSRRSRRSLGTYGSLSSTLSSSKSETSETNCTNEAYPAPSRGRYLGASLANMKPVSDHRKVESLPLESEISESLSTASVTKPVLPKVPTKTTSSTMLQRAARVYRRQKMIGSVDTMPQSRIELERMHSFETSGSLDSKQTFPAKGASFEDDISLAASLFSVTSIDNALSMGDVGSMKSSQPSKAILNLRHVHPSRNRSHVPQKQKYSDDHSVASTVTDATSILGGISHSMSEESTNGLFGSHSKLPMKQTNYSGSARAARLRRRLSSSS